MALPLAVILTIVVSLQASAQQAKSPDAAKASLARGFAKGTDVSKLDFSGQSETLVLLLDQAKYVQAGREPGDTKETYVAFIRSVAKRLAVGMDAAVALYGDRSRPSRDVAASQRELDARAAIAAAVKLNPAIAAAKKERLERNLRETSEYLAMGLNGDAGYVGAMKARPAVLNVTAIGTPKTAGAVYFANGERNWSALPPRVQPFPLVTHATPAPGSSGQDAGWVSWALETASGYATGAGRSIKNKYYAGKELIKEGFGYFIRPERTAHWGIDALVDGLRKIAAYMRSFGRADSDLHIGNLSSAKGGKLGGHLSHQTGRDVDIGFYMTDMAGKPAEHGMVHFNEKLVGERDGKKFRFDAQRNWFLVQAIMANKDPHFEPTRIFIAKHLEKEILAHAPNPGERAGAAKLMSYWPGHDNHLHLRVK